MEHLSLTDLGMTSIGHRLCLLRAVWELKLEQGLELGEEDWRPQGKESYTYVSGCDADQVIDIPETQVQKGGEQIDRLWDVILDQRKFVYIVMLDLEADEPRRPADVSGKRSSEITSHPPGSGDRYSGI